MWYNRGNIWFWQFSKLLKIGGGAHYYWSTATAGTGIGIEERYANAPYDICPAGWQLPRGYNEDGTVAELHRIVYNWGKTYFAEAWNIAAVTECTGTGCPYSPMSDYYMYAWSSTAYSSTQAYRIKASSATSFKSMTNIPSGSTRSTAMVVRCVAK